MRIDRRSFNRGIAGISLGMVASASIAGKVLAAPGAASRAIQEAPQGVDYLGIIDRLYDDVWNQHDLDAINEIFAADHVYNDPDTPGIVGGPEGYAQLVTLYSTALPDVHFTVNDVVINDQQVAVRWTAEGTFTGILMTPDGDIPGTDKYATIVAMAIYRFEGDKIVETQVIFDAYGFYSQIGLLPKDAPPQASFPLATPQAAFQAPPMATAAMTPEEATAIATNFYDAVWTGRNPAAVADFVTADYRYFDSALPALDKGPDQYSGIVAAFAAGLPDFTVEIDNTVSDGTTVALHWTGSGTHEGVLLGVPGTGAFLSVQAMSFLTFDGDKIATNWSVFDQYTLAQQLQAEAAAAAATPTT